MRRLEIGCLLALCLFALGCAAMQEKTRINNMTDEEVAAYNADPNNTDKIVCRKEKPTGSNIPRRVCRKQSWMDDRTDQDQREIETMEGNVNTITRPASRAMH